MTKRSFGRGAWLLVFVLFACADSAGPVTVDEVEGPFVWGSAEGVMRVRRLWLAGQPDEAGLAAAKQHGVSMVIDLRAPGEREWDEAAAAKRLGLSYENVVVPAKGPLPEAAFAEIEKLVRENPKARILVHCSSGNRAAAWLTAHLVQAHRAEPAEALEIGRRAGLTSEAMAERTVDYLDRGLER